MEYPEIKPILKKLEEAYSLASTLGLKVGTCSPHVIEADIGSISAMLHGSYIDDIVGYFQNHRPSSPYAKIEDEYKVQDLVYCVLSPIIPDLHFEDPQSKPVGGITSARVDFSSTKLNLLLEIKHVNSKSKATIVEAEISEDIIKYGRSRDFDYLLFYIYCSGYSFPKKAEFERGFTGSHKVGDNIFETICIVN